MRFDWRGSRVLSAASDDAAVRPSPLRKYGRSEVGAVDGLDSSTASRDRTPRYLSAVRGRIGSSADEEQAAMARLCAVARSAIRIDLRLSLWWSFGFCPSRRISSLCSHKHEGARTTL
eukprot:SAG31_NODE_4109_length_3573_cov_5.847726_2_plen_118_part_00